MPNSPCSDPLYCAEARDLASWRKAARPLLAAAVPPGSVLWSDWRNPSLRGNSCVHEPASGAVCIPRHLPEWLEDLACYRDPTRWELMYRLTWRVMNECRTLLDNDTDTDVRTARSWRKAVHRDLHKMHAFVRFHETAGEDGQPQYVAWFEPSHEILRAAAPFFEKRFPNMRWMIATPDGAILHELDSTRFLDSPRHAHRPGNDSTHSLWRSYYRSICNAARINPAAMQREMPKRYWHFLPEAREIGPLLDAGRNIRVVSAPDGDDLQVPRAVALSLSRIAQPAGSLQSCRLCDLWRHATQPVSGEGPADASLMLVGEQPGDEEDLRGRPFVGPAGRLLDEILGRSGLDRARLFVTNSVKHFKWEPRGKRRLHKRPDQQEVRACSVWLDREIAQVAPAVIVALGSTAIRALTGTALGVEEARRTIQAHASGAKIVCTYHPSAILRSEGERKEQLMEALTSDLRRAAELDSERAPPVAVR